MSHGISLKTIWMPKLWMLNFTSYFNICFQNPIERDRISGKKSAPVIPGYATSPRITEKTVSSFLAFLFDTRDMLQQGFIPDSLPGQFPQFPGIREDHYPTSNAHLQIPGFTSYFGNPKFPLFLHIPPEIRYLRWPERHRFPSGGLYASCPGEGHSFTCPAVACSCPDYRYNPSQFCSHHGCIALESSLQCGFYHPVNSLATVSVRVQDVKKSGCLVQKMRYSWRGDRSD